MAVVYQRGYVADTNGTPLDGGKLYIGTVNLDPQTNPIQAYWDSAFSVPATQPITITAGYTVNAGTRAAVYVNAASYSMRVRNSADVQVDYIANSSQSGVTSVDISGGTSGLTFSGGPIIGSGTITAAGTLAVANGGTGSTTAANARTALSAAQSGANADITTLRDSVTVAQSGTIASTSIGYRGVPLSGQTQGSTITLALTDAGKRVANTTGGWIIPANASVAFPTDSVMVLHNNSTLTQTVAITTDTLTLTGSTTTGTRTVAANGLATITKVGATNWLISGNVT